MSDSQAGYSPDVCQFGRFLLRKGIFESLCPGIKPVSECKKAYLKAVVKRKKPQQWAPGGITSTSFLLLYIHDLCFMSWAPVGKDQTLRHINLY